MSSSSSLLPSEQTTKRSREGRLRELHALLGIVPVGAFLLFHISTNSFAMQSAARFERVVGSFQALPGWAWLEVASVYLPLSLYAGYGLGIRVTRRYSGLRQAPTAGARAISTVFPTRAAASPLDASWTARAQREVSSEALHRTTGLLAVAFIVLHLAHIRWRLFTGELTEMELHSVLMASLSSTTSWGVPLVSILYLSGVTICTFYVGHGVCRFAGRRLARRSRRVQLGFARVVTALAVALWFVGVSTVVYYATGARWLFFS